MTRWALLAGGKGTGKSTRAAAIAEQLAARGLTIAGFVQDAVSEEGERVGYDLRRLCADERLALARRGVPRAHGEQGVCSYAFSTAAFEAARAWLAADADVLVLDEISKLEVAGGGHHDAVRDALAAPGLTLLSVRGDQLFAVLERFGLGEPVVALERDEPEALAAFVDALAREARR